MIKMRELSYKLFFKAAQEMIEKSGQVGVPVIDIDGTVIVGFDKNALKKALKI